MFRKPKRKAKQGLRRKEANEEEESSSGNGVNGAHDGGDTTTSELLSEARKRVKMTTGKAIGPNTASSSNVDKGSGLLHSYKQQENDISSSKAHSDLATSTTEQHPENLLASKSAKESTAALPNDGIFRNKERNKFLAGPIKAAGNIRVTSRFDYEPNICKDYKETGFCGFGDTCIYLHDRGDTLAGWQIEQQWQQQQEQKRQEQERALQQMLEQSEAGKDGEKPSIDDDGLPFACHLCRDYFNDPVVTNCQHYFCEKCIMDHVREQSELCPICSQDTGSVFNQPTKLIAKRKKLLGRSNTSWKEFAEACGGSSKVASKVDAS